MRIKDMQTGTIAVTGRGTSNRIVVVVRPETWNLRRTFYANRTHQFAKGKSTTTYQMTNGVLAIETDIYTGSVGYFHDVDFDSEKVTKTIDRAVREAHRLAALSDGALLAELNVGNAPSGKYGMVDVITTGNMTHTLEEFKSAVIEQTERRRREREHRDAEKRKREDATESIRASFAKLGIDIGFSVDGEKVTIFGTERFTEALAKIAEGK